MLGHAAVAICRPGGGAVAPIRDADERARTRTPHRPAPEQRIELRPLIWWDRLTAAFARCDGLSVETLQARTEFLDALRLAQHYSRLESRIEFSESEVAHIGTKTAAALDGLRSAVLADIAARISTGHWLTSIYEALSAAPSVSTFVCACGSTGLRVRFRILGADAIEPVRDECDRCGTQHDWIGRRAGRARPTVDVSEMGLSVTVPPLPRGAIGRVLLHRVAHPPLDWPAQGGRCEFPADVLEMRGRRVAVALSAGPFGLHARYGFFFLPPRAPDAPPGRREPVACD
jgi:hypothetical protein